MGTIIKPLASRLPNEGPAVYYSAPFRDVIEQHLTYLIASNTHELAVDPHIAFKYKADFYGLLQYLGVAPQMWWVVLRVNNMTTPADYTEEMLSILIPDFNEIEKLRTSYTTIHRIS